MRPLSSDRPLQPRENDGGVFWLGKLARALWDLGGEKMDDYVQQDITRTLDERIVGVLEKREGPTTTAAIASALGLSFDVVNDATAFLYWGRKHGIQRTVHVESVEYEIP